MHTIIHVVVGTLVRSLTAKTDSFVPILYYQPAVTGYWKVRGLRGRKPCMTSDDLAAGAAGILLPSVGHFSAYSLGAAKNALCQSMGEAHIKILKAASPPPD